MTIACLAWGSLVSDPRELPCVSEWRSDGPELPIEFARQSQDGRLTLVVAEGARLCTTLWCELAVRDLDEAIQVLQHRENTPNENSIGRWPNATARKWPYSAHVAAWAEARGLVGVVWTALWPGWIGSRGLVPTMEEAVTYLQGLDPATVALAASYIRSTPAQVVTEFRPALEAELDRLAAL